MMVCQACQANPATVHLTEIRDKEKREIHLCTRCAQEKGISIKADFSLGEIFGGLLDPSAPAAPGTPPGTKDPKEKERDRKEARMACPRCGLTYSEFRKTGRLGCPEDYDLFRKGLIPFLEKIHLSTQHVGKVPSRAESRTLQVKELIGLRRQLSSLVEKEAYEEAAKVRDRIKKLEEAP